MAILITIDFMEANQEPISVPLQLSRLSLAMVRYQFNPSGRREVDVAKVLGAALITMMEPMFSGPQQGPAGSQWSAMRAVERAEDAAMHAVKALTAGK